MEAGCTSRGIVRVGPALDGGGPAVKAGGGVGRGVHSLIWRTSPVLLMRWISELPRDAVEGRGGSGVGGA